MNNNVIVRSASFEASGLEAPQCHCHLDAVWRKVAKEGNNYGRHFWGCSRFGFKQRCQFFQWVEEDSPTTDPSVNRGLDKIKPAAAVLYDHNVSPSQTPTKNVDGSGNENENGNECGNENEDENVNETDTSPTNDQNCHSRLVRLQSEDSFTTVMGEDESPLFSGCNLENIKTPLASPCNDPTIPDASPQRPKFKKYKYYKTCASPNSSKYMADLKRRRDALETPPDNGIPRFTTPELLEIIENHMNQQDRFGYRQELSKELAREENRQLRIKMDQLSEDMNYMRREIQLLKHEKRVLELDLDVTQQELKDIKRRRHA